MNSRHVVAVASRCLAAALGGYAVANTCSIALAALLPLPRADAALVAVQVSFALYAAAVLWAFAARSALSAWIGLLVPAGAAGLLAWWLT